MTKAEYIDFIRNSLPQVDKTFRFHREQVAAAINEAVNTVFYEVYKKGSKTVRKSMERYTTVVISVPSLDNTINRYTSTLTVDVVDLPRKTGGVLEVLTAALVPPTKYIPVSTMEGEQFYGSEGSLPSNVTGFAFSGARVIEFWNLSLPEIDGDGVKIRLIKQFKSYTATDNVLLPYGQNTLV
jgi:hypothetical protein